MTSRTPTAPTRALVIPFAACDGEGWAQAMKAMPADRLRNLGRLLQGMRLVDSDSGNADSLSPPHERVLARLQGLAGENALPDGLIPWAAARAATLQLSTGPGQAWAWFTPCHWAMGREHATLTDPAALGLTPDESQAFMAALQPYVETDGIRLHYAAPDGWLAQGDLFQNLPTASLDRVLGRNVDAWLPGTKTGLKSAAAARQGAVASPNTETSVEANAAASRLRRLQNEMQMLLYTHPLNDARAERRLPAVNSFWVSGSGALDQAHAPAAAPTVDRSLAQAALADNWPAYADAWAALDAGAVAALLADQRAGKTVSLSLCGEKNAHTYSTAPVTLQTRFLSLLTPQPALNRLTQL